VEPAHQSTPVVERGGAGRGLPTSPLVGCVMAVTAGVSPSFAGVL